MAFCEYVAIFQNILFNTDIIGQIYFFWERKVFQHNENNHTTKKCLSLR